MTKTQFKKKIASMKKNMNKYIDEETLRLFSCGAIDNTSYSNDYLLPKIVLTVALENITHEYKPLSGMGKIEVNNLRRF